MTRRGQCGLAACALIVAASTACASGEATTDRSASVNERPLVATASTAKRSDVPARAPRVVDRGDDSADIVRSLLGYWQWLESHPDPALVDRAFSWRGDAERIRMAELSALRRTGNHVVEVDAAPPEVVIVSRVADVVSFHVTRHLARHDVVDRQGRVLRHAGPLIAYADAMISRITPNAPWRLSLLVRTPSTFEMW
jgi:hypothetical protein